MNPSLQRLNTIYDSCVFAPDSIIYKLLDFREKINIDEIDDQFLIHILNTYFCMPACEFFNTFPRLSKY